MHLDPETVQKIIKGALEEDIGTGDLTSQALIPENATGNGEILAKQAGILAGLSVAELVFRELDPQIKWHPLKQDGESILAGDVVVKFQGNLRAILAAERTALNLLQRMSGIASLTRQFVDAVQGCSVKILDTRKTAPGLRMLDKYAVRMGGGTNHRMGLHDAILVKENHIRAAGGIQKAVKSLLQQLPSSVRIEVEVCNQNEVDEALAAGANVLLLDNMSIQDMKEAVRKIHPNALVEASGGVRLENVRDVAATGVDFISVGALTHSVQALDFSLEITA
ncbi:MAG: nicotinate-nucleotide diphosphorylase (carboxylating) [Acidobacteria bacterium RIFCSPLOWO2_12_FULL_54_10]|nr:MAG: nicotinate-nucleotide diphosphorylase (carboxylating) [Acidobacteria bacterium RIFCSPLOWO2_12_FULL_54_10]